jgi:WD40 repeat protein
LQSLYGISVVPVVTDDEKKKKEKWYPEGVAWSPDCNRLAFGMDGRIHIWDLRTAKSELTIVGPQINGDTIDIKKKNGLIYLTNLSWAQRVANKQQLA